MDITTMSPIATAVVPLIQRILDKREQVAQKRLDAEALLRAYYFELCGNLTILSSFIKENLKIAGVGTPGFHSLISRLSTDIADYILLDPVEKNLASFLEETGDLQLGAGKRRTVTMRKAMSFSIITIETLQRLSDFSEEEKRFVKKKFNLKAEMERIRSCLLMIRRCLKDKPGVAEIYLDEIDTIFEGGK
jgi:hypothetical protein